jgi:oxygen-dependent protoporphyrinogen oxidase
MIDVVVVGGGVAGLAAADRLGDAGAEVALLEAADRLGGNVRTVAFAGRPLDMGAEALLSREPTARDLCRQLSLDGEVVTPSCGRAFVWTPRGLRPLPADAIARMPGEFAGLIRSGLLSPLGLLRCGWDLIAPCRAPEGDVSIGDVVRSRLGRQVLDRVVDPLIGGIHGGGCDTLSARALTPQLVVAMETGKGLARGLRVTSPPADGPAFFTLRTGLESIVAALSTRAEAQGVSVRLSAPALGLDVPSPGRARVHQPDGDALDALACVVAAPAGVAAHMLCRAAPAAATELAAITYAPPAVVALAYPAEALASLPRGTGFVTAGRERLVRACTWSSSKWDHLRGDPVILKAFVGRAGAPPPAIGDRQLAALVHQELAAALALRSGPVDQRVHRFVAAIPQYLVGHQERVARIEAALPPHIAVAGASYRGQAVSSCVRSGRAAAEQILRYLGVIASDRAILPASRSLA